MGWFFSALGALAAAYGLLLLLLLAFQRRLLFFARGRGTPAMDLTLLPAGRLERLATADGETLDAWIMAPKDGRPVLVYLPGALDALDQGHRQERFAALTAQGLGLLAIDYRGYGGSTGAPGEEGFRRDALAAYQTAAARFGPGRIVLYGESMGTVLATGLAGKVPARALILEAPMCSMRALVERLLPIVPVRAIMKDMLASDTRIADVRMPLLILHGMRDKVVPIAHGRRLFALARPPKRFVSFAAGNHINLARHGLGAEVEAFLAALEAGRLPPEEIRQVS